MPQLCISGYSIHTTRFTIAIMNKIEPTKIFDSPYYAINKKLLIILGLWPDLSRVRKTASLAIFTLISFSLIIPIVVGFKNVLGVDMVAFIENCVGFLYFTAIYSKYLSAYMFQNRIELVYKQTVIDWQNMTDEDELRILDRYARLGRLLTYIYVGYSALAVCVFNSFPYIPFVMDTLIPIENQTRQRIYPYHPDYFLIDSEQYFFHLFTFHGIFVVAFTTFAVAAIDSMMVANIIHACGLFAVVCHRLENIGKLSKSEENGNLQLADDLEIYRRCKKVCELHLSSINVDMIQNSFSISFLVVMGAGMVAIGMLMFDFLYSLDEDLLKVAIILVLLFGINVCLFYLNWVVQQVINSSEKVFQYAYYSRWYNLSINSRKLICFIQQNSMKPISLSAASICDLNLEMFASVVKTSMSYATVMLSMQQQ